MERRRHVLLWCTAHPLILRTLDFGTHAVHDFDGIPRLLLVYISRFPLSLLFIIQLSYSIDVDQCNNTSTHRTDALSSLSTHTFSLSLILCSS
ncbi:hypothetical protein PYCCODRAFT_120170 [Trametes coccinea BRFM310]|uniref:Uncharacterized protein n=1 Tax=Trametes coccinea (strain BRFM310) TaxID=1353009 RepID=A0A1Y2IU27_TRAC3|nr:hypothetical protein PYCCODRAFT_120170 [Trametes coccinea BRFM310]